MTLNNILSMLTPKLSPAIKFIIIRTARKAWRTATRFHSLPNVCRFGCRRDNPGSLAHYLVCPVLHTSATNILHLDLHTFQHDSLATCFNPIHQPKHIPIIAHITATHYTFESIRHSHVLISVPNLYASAIKHLASKDILIHKYLNA